MTDNIQTGNFQGVPVVVRTTEVGGIHTPHHRDPEAHTLLQDLIEAEGDVGVALAGILAKLIAAPASAANQATIIGHVDGIEATLTALLAKIIAAPATEAKQDAQIAATAAIGTRAYGTPQRIASAAATALSAPIAATEVLLHASGRQFVLAVGGTGNPTITNAAAIPLEDGEKFHMRITSGQRIATIRDTADGFLHIAPVA